MDDFEQSALLHSEGTGAVLLMTPSVDDSRNVVKGWEPQLPPG